ESDDQNSGARRRRNQVFRWQVHVEGYGESHKQIYAQEELGLIFLTPGQEQDIDQNKHREGDDERHPPAPRHQHDDRWGDENPEGAPGQVPTAQDGPGQRERNRENPVAKEREDVVVEREKAAPMRLHSSDDVTSAAVGIASDE